MPEIPGDVVFFQVGRYCEFYQGRDASAARLLGLTAIKPNRRGARWGFALTRLAGYLDAAVRAGRSVVLVLQQRAPATGFITRAAVARYEVAEIEKCFPIDLHAVVASAILALPSHCRVCGQGPERDGADQHVAA